MPAGQNPGSTNTYLTVGTYPVANVYATTKKHAARRGTVTVAVGGKAFAFYDSSRPTNVYLAYPGANVQIEGYDPSLARDSSSPRTRSRPYAEPAPVIGSTVP